MSAVANFTTRHGFCSILGKNTAFCVYSVHVKYWCATNSNLAYFIELTTALECQKQLLMSSISNLGGRESLEIAVNLIDSNCDVGESCPWFLIGTVLATGPEYIINIYVILGRRNLFEMGAVRSARESRPVALVWRLGILVTGAWFCTHGKQ